MIQKFFHTDKWWGKGIFIILIYSIFWCIFYGLLFLIPDIFFEINNIPGYFTLIYALLIVPFISFFLIRFFKKYFYLKNSTLYIIHILYIILSIILFFIFLVIGALKNYSGF